MKRTILTMLTISALSVVVFYGCKDKEPAAESGTGKIAPDFTLTDYDDKPISFSDYKGKIVVLEWFNYECPFVQHHYEKAKTMIELANKYNDKNVVWLAINSTGHLTTEKNKEFVKKYKIGYPILDDRSGKTGRAYGARTTPHMFIIDTKGRIAYAIMFSQFFARQCLCFSLATFIPANPPTLYTCSFINPNLFHNIHSIVIIGV